MIDLGVFRTDSPSQPIRFDFARTNVAVDLYQLAQRVTLRLLTPLGNAYGQPSFGSNLIRDIRLGRYSNATAITLAFNSERQAILRQVALDERDSRVRMKDLTLAGVSLIGDKVSLRLRVKSNMETEAVFGIET